MKPLKSLRKSKKSLTPIIAVILLLMMVVAGGGAMYYWLSRIQGQMQGNVESYQSNLFTGLTSAVDVVNADYNGTTYRLDVFFQNTGNRKISLDNGSTYPTTNWILFDSDRESVCSTHWAGGANGTKCISGCGTAIEIEIGQISEVLLELNGTDCDIKTEVNGSVFSFTVDFSGKTTTSGSFIKEN